MDDFFDKELGLIVIKRNNRAKRVIARRKHNAVEITVPKRLPKREIIRHFEELKPQILSLPVRKVVKIDEESKIETFTFDVLITRKSECDDKAAMVLKDGLLTIDVPQQHNIHNKNMQKTIKDLIIKALRSEAKKVLPEKVAYFAEKYNLKVNKVKINTSKHRWGSCTSKKNINLSLYLMMLPERLIDYVILHELAHTIELNHSRKFWQILDQFCNGKAEALNNESRYWDTDYLYSLKQ